MFTITNTLENKVVFESNNEPEFVNFMRKIAVENDDEELSITCLSEAKEYLEVYCSNLKLN